MLQCKWFSLYTAGCSKSWWQQGSDSISHRGSLHFSLQSLGRLSLTRFPFCLLAVMPGRYCKSSDHVHVCACVYRKIAFLLHSVTLDKSGRTYMQEVKTQQAIAQWQNSWWRYLLPNNRENEAAYHCGKPAPCSRRKHRLLHCRGETLLFSLLVFFLSPCWHSINKKHIAQGVNKLHLIVLKENSWKKLFSGEEQVCRDVPCSPKLTLVNVKDNE